MSLPLGFFCRLIKSGLFRDSLWDPVLSGLSQQEFYEEIKRQRLFQALIMCLSMQDSLSLCRSITIFSSVLLVLAGLLIYL